MQFSATTVFGGKPAVHWLLALSGVLLAAASGPALAEHPATTLTTLLDRAYIEDMLVDYYGQLGSNRSDFGSFYVPEGILDVNGIVVQGQKPIEDLYKKMPQNFPEHPHDVFRRNIWVSPFWEGCVSDVVETVGWDKVLFGSDYPHPEGLAEPKGFWKYAEGMDERRTYDFMGDNARRFMGLPIANPDPAAVKPPVLSNA